MSLLGFLGNVATGFLTGGPVGAIAGGVVGSGILGKGGAPAPPKQSPLVNIATAVKQIAQPPAAKYSAPVPALTSPTQVMTLPVLPGGGQVSVDSVKTSGVQLFPGTFAGTQTVYSSPAGGGKGPPGPGYHLNRSGYYTKHGYVPKGSVWVKNRRRNPLNPRALSRSMSRIHSAKRAVHFLDRIQIGPKRRRR